MNSNTEIESKLASYLFLVMNSNTEIESKLVCVVHNEFQQWSGLKAKNPKYILKDESSGVYDGVHHWNQVGNRNRSCFLTELQQLL